MTFVDATFSCFSKLISVCVSILYDLLLHHSRGLAESLFPLSTKGGRTSEAIFEYRKSMIFYQTLFLQLDYLNSKGSPLNFLKSSAGRCFLYWDKVKKA